MKMGAKAVDLTRRMMRTHRAPPFHSTSIRLLISMVGYRSLTIEHSHIINLWILKPILSVLHYELYI